MIQLVTNIPKIEDYFQLISNQLLISLKLIKIKLDESKTNKQRIMSDIDVESYHIPQENEESHPVRKRVVKNKVKDNKKMIQKDLFESSAKIVKKLKLVEEKLETLEKSQGKKKERKTPVDLTNAPTVVGHRTFYTNQSFKDDDSPNFDPMIRSKRDFYVELNSKVVKILAFRKARILNKKKKYYFYCSSEHWGELEEVFGKVNFCDIVDDEDFYTLDIETVKEHIKQGLKVEVHYFNSKSVIYEGFVYDCLHHKFSHRLDLNIVTYFQISGKGEVYYTDFPVAIMRFDGSNTNSENKIEPIDFNPDVILVNNQLMCNGIHVRAEIKDCINNYDRIPAHENVDEISEVGKIIPETFDDLEELDE